MANTTNLNLYKPSRDDYISVTRDISDNMQKIDDAYGTMSSSITNLTGSRAKNTDLAIVVDGNTSSKDISKGDYVIVINSTISGVTDGVYLATTDISSGTSVTSSKVVGTDTGNGGFNALLSQINILLQAKSFQEPTNLDTLYEAGNYFCGNNTSNKPTGVVGICEVVATNNPTSQIQGWVYQIYHSITDLYLYIRSNINQTGWSNWMVVDNGYPCSAGENMDSTVDFNDFLTPGISSFSSNEYVSGSLNKPCDIAGRLFVWTLNGKTVGSTSGQWEYAVQDYTDLLGGKYVRTISKNGTTGDLTYGDWGIIHQQRPQTISDINVPCFYQSIWNKLVVFPTKPFNSFTDISADIYISGEGWQECTNFTVTDPTTPFSYITMDPPSGFEFQDGMMYVCSLSGEIT